MLEYIKRLLNEGTLKDIIISIETFDNDYRAFSGHLYWCLYPKPPEERNVYYTGSIDQLAESVSHYKCWSGESFSYSVRVLSENDFWGSPIDYSSLELLLDFISENIYK